MKKIFATGGAGFIGTWVTKVLLDNGYEVTVYDNLSSGNKDTLDSRATFIEGDLSDQDKLEQALKGHEAVIHMAAFIEVAESIKKPIAYGENNVINSIRLLEAMKNTGVDTILFSSSATVYGTPKNLPITETDPIGVPSNQYGASKIATEFFCQTYHTLYNFNVILLRYFNPYGPGEQHKPESHAIPNFIRAGLDHKPIPLYWKGEAVRDFIYIEDLAKAHMAVLDQKGLSVFNVGTEQGVKVKDALAVIEKILGYPLEIADLGERPGDVMANYASYQKLAQLTGWKPAVSLEEGIRRTIEYYKQSR